MYFPRVVLNYNYIVFGTILLALFLFLVSHQTPDKTEVVLTVDNFQSKNVANKGVINISDNNSTSDPYSMDNNNLQKFFARKEEQYARRRERIANFCQIFSSVYNASNSNILFHVDKKKFVYAPEHKIAYCQIPKVSTAAFKDMAIDPHDLATLFSNMLLSVRSHN